MNKGVRTQYVNYERVNTVKWSYGSESEVFWDTSELSIKAYKQFKDFSKMYGLYFWDTPSRSFVKLQTLGK